MAEQGIEIPSRRLINTSRVSARGKHLWDGDEPARVHGVTYGSFARRPDGTGFPDTSTIRRDFAAMRWLGLNTVRTYELPPQDLLEAAAENDLRVFVGLDYRDWRTEQGTDRSARRRISDAAKRAVDDALERLAGRPEVLAVAVGNEVPVDLVRLHGRAHLERTLTATVTRLHDGDPAMLATYVNFPTTEFLQIPNLDLITFNVFLEHAADFRRYVEHLQLISRDRPLLITEMGLASEVHGESAQADLMSEQLRDVDELGAAGGVIFSWTDEWVVAGESVAGWGFGLTTVDRKLKPVSRVVSEWANLTYPKGLRDEWPLVSVIVCAYNEEETIGECLDSVLASTYPDLELILCDDGSTDATAEIAAKRGVRTLGLSHGGLSRARNAGLHASNGGIVAYLDADAACHPDWPFHLALSFETGVAASGGPNLPFADVGLVERAIAHVPGQASEVLLGPGSAEHVPGCNMAFNRDRLIEIGGFDVRYVAAGDDVDVCWKLLDRRYKIGFSPAGQVEHHRRATTRGFLRQQVGYGRAERMLMGPHRNRINLIGQARWRGFVYGPGGLLPRLFRSTVYTGWTGSAPFQPTISQRSKRVGGMVSSALPPLVVGGVFAALAGIVVPAAFILSFVIAAWIFGVGVSAALSAELPHNETGRRRARWLIGVLTVLQPLVRTWGRIRATPLDVTPPPDPPWVGDRLAWIDTLARSLRSRGRAVRLGGSGDFWDLEVTGRGPIAVRLSTAVAWAWEPRSVVRYRLRPGWAAGLGAVIALSFLAGPVWGAMAALGAIVVSVLSTSRTVRRVRHALATTTRNARSGSTLPSESPP